MQTKSSIQVIDRLTTLLDVIAGHDVPVSTKLWREVKTALQQGYALDNQEAELGVGCIGVAVRDSSNTMVAGISVSAPLERRHTQQWIPLIKQAGERLSARLGYHGR